MQKNKNIYYKKRIRIFNIELMKEDNREDAASLYIKTNPNIMHIAVVQ